MTSALARYSGILSALLTLFGVADWVLQGAPGLPMLAPAWHTVATGFLYDLGELAPWAPRLALILICPSLLLSAVLSLFMLLRGSGTAYVRYLGAGLGWWSFALFYMTILPVLPGVMSWPLPLPALVCADVVTLVMSLAAAYAFLRFWSAFPRPITSAELQAFLVEKTRRDFAALSPWRQRWARLLTPTRDPDWIGYRARRFGALNRAIFGHHLQPSRLVTAVALAIAAVAGLLWRVDAYLHDRELAGMLGMVPFVVLLFIFMLPWINLANILRMHRATGSAGERRKIEWVSASFWIALVVFFTFAALSNMPLLYQGIFGGDALSPGTAFQLMTLQFLTPLLGPLLLLLALTVSIFYRGEVDPKLALRGITLWTLVGVVLTLVFALVERSVAVRLGALLGLPPQTGYVAAGAVVAATFQPIRKLAEKQVNRFVARALPAAGSNDAKPDAGQPKNGGRKRRKKTARLRRRNAT